MAAICCDTPVLVYWVRKRWLYLYTRCTLFISEINARVLLYTELKTVFGEAAPTC